MLALGVNGIVGVGIFFAPREVALVVPGLSGLWVYLGVAALLLPVGLVYARLGRAFPRDGGPYLYARAAFGPRAAFAVGWTTYVSGLFSTATVLVGLVDSVAVGLHLTSPAVRLAIELALLTALMLGLSRGLRLSAVTWSLVTVLKALPLLALPIAAAFAAPPAAPQHAALTTSWLGAALPVLFALQGFEIVPLPAAHVRHPERNVPLATTLSLLFAAVLYLGLHAACVLAVPDLASSVLPLADAAGRYGGPTFYRVMIGATNVSALGIAVGMLAMTPRYLAPLGHDDGLGGKLDQESARGVPVRAFVVTYVFLALMLVASASPAVGSSVGHLLALSSLCVTAQYAVTAAALWVLAARRTFGLSLRDLWPAPCALAACAVLAAGSSREEVPVALAMLLVGVVARFARGHIDRSRNVV